MNNTVQKSDFYYGAFISKVVDNGTIPAIITKGGNRGVYRLKRGEKNHLVYIKCATIENKNINRWNFSYTDDNINEIEEYINKKENSR